MKTKVQPYDHGSLDKSWFAWLILYPEAGRFRLATLLLPRRGSCRSGIKLKAAAPHGPSCR